MAAARHRLLGGNPMSGLYIMLDKGTKVKAFSSASRGGRSTVKIELDVPDPRELGYLLERLGEAQGPKKAPAQKRHTYLLEHKPEVANE